MKRAVKVFSAIVGLCLGLALVLQHCSDGPSKAQLSPEEVEQICVYIVSCQHEYNPASTETVSACVSELMWLGMAEYGTSGYDETISCMVDAALDCEELWRCGNEGHAPETCDPATFEDRCEGSMMVQCGEGTIVYFDCAHLDPLYGDAICHLESSTGELDCVSGVTCEGSYSSCDGNVLEMCIEGDFWRMDCRLLGASCETVPPGFDTCVGRGKSCTDDGSAWCEGTTVVRCMGGREARFNCSVELGSEFTCIESEPGEFECGPSATDCDGETHADTCDGNSIDYCRWGHTDSVSCTSHGYASCAEGTSSAFCQ